MKVNSTTNVGYDNCKFIFMLYVVLWHAVNPTILESATSTSARWGPVSTHVVTRYWLWTEKIAVPGFAFLSGFFAKGFLQRASIEKERKRWEKTISVLLVGPLLWQCLYGALDQLITRAWLGKWNSEVPHSFDVWEELGTWYLFALLLWRLMTPLIARLRHPVVASVALSFLSAHTNWGYPLQMRNRAFFFLPFYVAGLYFEDNWLSRHGVRHSRILGVSGVFLTLTICQVIDRDSLGWKYTIDSWAISPHLVLLFQYVLSGAAVLSIVSGFRTLTIPLLPWGHANATLAIYEWHWPIAGILGWGQLPFTQIKIMEDPVMKRIFSSYHPLVAVVGSHLLCYGACVLLGNRQIWEFILKHACDPSCKWMFRSSTNNELPLVDSGRSPSSSSSGIEVDHTFEGIGQDAEKDKKGRSIATFVART